MEIKWKAEIEKSGNEDLLKAPNVKYIKQFMSYNCLPDVLISIGKIRKVIKEVTESVSVIRPIKRVALKVPGTWNLVEFCAGNSLTSILLAHLFDFKKVVAIDIAQRELYRPVRGYERIQKDIYDLAVNGGSLDLQGGRTIFLAVHACRDLASQVINLYDEYDGEKMLVLMPCCKGSSDAFVPRGIRDNFDKYQIWTYQLAQDANADFWFDKACLSPCNGVIVSRSWENNT